MGSRAAHASSIDVEVMFVTAAGSAGEVVVAGPTEGRAGSAVGGFPHCALVSEFHHD